MNGPTASDSSERDRLVAELEEAEAFVQQLRAAFVEIQAALAAGHPATALSRVNEALRNIDDATDVVAPHAAESAPRPFR